MSARPAHQLQIGQWIVNAEARRDAGGRIQVYTIPKGDGGGKYEIAGINDRYHPQVAAHLRSLIRLGQHAAAEQAAVDCILGYTDVVNRWTAAPSIQAFLRDCAFNRGPGGAAKILQIALGVAADGHVGPITLAALAKIRGIPAFLQALRAAREAYERRIAPPAGARAKFWQGLAQVGGMRGRLHSAPSWLIRTPAMSAT